MTITLSQEVEADIRELLRLWGWDANDPVKAEAVARGVLKDGLTAAIDVARKLAYRQALVDDLPNAPGAIEITCRACGKKQAVLPESACARSNTCVDCYWEGIPQVVPDARVFEERDHHGLRWVTPPSAEPPDIAEGTEVRTSGGRLLVWRGGSWAEVGGAK